MRLPISPRIALCLALGGISTGHAAHGQETTPPAAKTPAAPAAAPPTAPAPPAGTDAKPPAQETTPAPATATASPMPAAAGSPATPAATVPPTAPPHTALFRYYDKNGDQVLSAEELAKVPQPIREWLDKQKVDVAAGLTKEAFETSAPKLIEHLRSRTAETILAPVPLPAPGSVPAPSSGGSGRSQRGGSGGSSEFRAIDLDGDAQLSFREWRAGKRLAGEFQPRDMNGDGVVTASEFDQTKALASTTPPSSSGPSRPMPPGAPMAPGSTPAPPSGTPGTTPPASTGTPAASGLGTTASRQTFDSLDKNKDGMISPDEWGGSRRVGPAFKEKGIDISKNMTREDFHANYAKAFPPR